MTFFHARKTWFIDFSNMNSLNTSDIKIEISQVVKIRQVIHKQFFFAPITTSFPVGIAQFVSNLWLLENSQHYTKGLILLRTFVLILEVFCFET